MTIPELHDRVKAAVKGVVGTPECQALFREGWDNTKADLLVRAITLGALEAGQEVCDYMDARPGTSRNPRW